VDPAVPRRASLHVCVSTAVQLQKVARRQPFGTATPVTNRGIRRHSAILGEFGPAFLNGPQRSVNRKVQGSNPCSGAKNLCKFG
jgi:hypothetical protein